MTERTFLIQRYASANWPQVKGLRPFIVSGPMFDGWIVPDSLQKTGRHVVRPSIRRTLERAFPEGTGPRLQYHHSAMAEVLLREHVLMALWSVDSVDCISLPGRWNESIEQVCREIPFCDDSLSRSVEDLLSGMPSPSMAREYLSEDGLTLEPCPVPEATGSP